MDAPSASEVAALLGDWPARGSGSLAARLAFSLRSRILADLLPPGTALPPERLLADALAVSRSTLVSALDLLRSEGLVTSRQGSATRVTAPPAADTVGTPLTMAARLLGAAGRAINFGISAPPAAAQLPALAVTSADLLAAVPSHGYDPVGLFILRAALAERHTASGLPTRPEEIQVTHGAQHAIDLALATLCPAGDAVAVEDPTYPGVLDVLAARRLRAVPIAGDARGPTPAGLEDAARNHGARLAFLLPAVHNPTGRVLDPGRRQALARTLDRLEMTAVEDNTLADLAYDEARPPSLAALCRKALVVTVETTSKVAWGGLRVGWLRAPSPVIERSVRQRTSGDLGCSVPAQLLARQLLDHYDGLIAARRTALQASATRFGALLAEAIPGCTFDPPAGGLSLWVRLPDGADAAAFASRALRHGVSVAPGLFASPAGGHDHLRLCHDRPDEEITEGLARLAAAWSETTPTVVFA
jgi:DNA-binding transcriptional MocR family regulator